jgi:hypothetical protein
MNRWIQAATAAAVIAIVFVIFVEYQKSSEAAAWTRLGEARTQENLIDALESAREATTGTEAEPWIAFELTMALYEEGGAADLQRAAQVARATIGEYPGHAVTKLLEGLLPALDSYATAPGA